MKFNREMLEKALQKRIFGWVDSQMKDLVPSDIYHSAHSRNNDDRSRAYGWLSEKGYRVVSENDGTVHLYRGTTLIRSTKLVLELDDPEELLQIAETVKENVNIPPPPWQNDVAV